MSAGVVIGSPGELCCACEVRRATGTSLNGHPMCSRCRGDAEWIANEYAVEVEAARGRRDDRVARDRPRVLAALARLGGHEEARSPTPVVSARAAVRHRRGRDAAAKVNALKSREQKAIRESAVIGAIARAECAVSIAGLVLATGLSYSTIKRAIAELCLERKLTARRAKGSCTFYYALRHA